MEPITELRDRILTLKPLESKMAHLQNELHETELEVDRLLMQYERESRDVERIQRETLSSFLQKIIGKYEDRLEKERREEIEAKLAYDRAVMRREDLLREKEELSSRIAVLREEDQKYQAELTARKQELAGRLTEPEGILYADLAFERTIISAAIAEIKEARAAAARAKGTAKRAIKELESAEGWATYDVFLGKGLISHAVKYSHIDDAEHCFHLLSSQLRDLRAEVKDVRGLDDTGLHAVSAGQRTIDFFFDNIFTDLSVRGQIRDNAAEIQRLLSTINALEARLKKLLQEEEAKLRENRRREEELLLSL